MPEDCLRFPVGDMKALWELKRVLGKVRGEKGRARL